VEDDDVLGSQAGVAAFDLADAGSGDFDGFGEVRLGPGWVVVEATGAKISADLGSKLLVEHVDILLTLSWGGKAG